MLLMAASLFATAFLAATILPLSSEALLIAALDSFPDNMWFWLLVAGTGNSLGSAVNWVLGRWLIDFQDRRWFPVSKKDIQRAENFFTRWGWPSLLLSWLPVIGDPLTVVAGILRFPFKAFIILIVIAKFTRYLIIIFLYKGLIAF